MLLLACLLFFLASGVQFSHTANRGYCPEGAFQWYEECYVLYEYHLTWSDARMKCQKAGHNLVNSPDRASEVLRYVYDYKDLTVWVGVVSDRGTDVKLSGSITQIITPDKCATSTPKTLVSKRKTYQGCNDRLPFICQLTPEPACPDTNWMSDPSREICIKVYFTAVDTWFEARKQCQANAGDLVVIKNVPTRLFIEAFVVPDAMYWIGLHSPGKDDEFKWLDETQKATYYLWDIAQPDNHFGDEYCVALTGSRTFWPGSLWNDVPCSTDQHRPICQKNAYPRFSRHTTIP